ncbi:MAG: zinc ribbon domain-containing protein [Eubacteriales bacterium]|nr:zinc ribbon domain-containing protein [Eubacteriales bacterium]
MSSKGSDFFDGLSETITRRAREIGEKAESLYEIQKMRNKLHAEERLREKTLSSLGYMVYARFCVNGELEDEEMEELCRIIQKHDKIIRRCKADISKAKGEKECPSCGKGVAAEASFCPYCGASCKDGTEEAKEQAAENEGIFAEETQEEAPKSEEPEDQEEEAVQGEGLKEQEREEAAQGEELSKEETE